MAVLRNVGVGVTGTALLVLATACGGSEKSSTPSSSSKTSSSAASSSSPTPTTATSEVAPLGDYTYLLLQASDFDPPTTTMGAPQQNPGDVAGAVVTFASPDHSRTIADMVVIFTDATIAARQAKEHAQSFPKYVTAAPQSFEVGTNGLVAVGMSPDGSKAVTYVTFAEGRVAVDLEFDSAPNDPAPTDVVLEVARKQDAIVKSKLPG